MKINVDAYIVRGMSTPFILGNDYADQYSISIIRREGESFLSFGDTGRELKVENSTSSSFLDDRGNTFKVRVIAEASTRFAKIKAHRKSQKRRRRQRLEQHHGEVRSREHVVIPAESCVRVAVELPIPEGKNDLLIERNIQQDHHGRQFFGSPDSLISPSNPFVHISNFSDSPVVIGKRQVVGCVHNPKNWLDRIHTPAVRKRNKAHARFIQQMTYEEGQNLGSQSRSAHIRSESDITSKAQRNVFEPDDPSAQEPVEGGPKTSLSGPELTLSSVFLKEVDISPSLTESQRQAILGLLEKNQAAFGLDGRLGNHDAQVQIQLKKDAKPVSLPPFSTSPANREVMNKQMDA